MCDGEPSTEDPGRQEEPELENWVEWETTGKGRYIISTDGDFYVPRATLGIVGNITVASKYGRLCCLCTVAKVFTRVEHYVIRAA